jgi:peptidoglycan glycosyltransferase
MEAVVSRGTASSPPVFPADESVAAKTGTAEVGPNHDYTTDWMIAFAPASHPKVVVAVVASFRSKKETGAQVAGPATCAILQAAIRPAQGCP